MMVLVVLFPLLTELQEPPSMVLAIAALLVQFHPMPQAFVPAFTVASPAGITATDGTKPKRTTPTDSAVAVVASTSGTGHIETSSVKLAGDSSENGTPGLSAASTTDHGNTQALELVRIPEPAPLKPDKVYRAETPRMSRSWLALSLVQHGAAAFDAYSTRQSIGRGAVEDDPLMRPFAHSGAIYAAIQVGPVLLDYVARRMQHSEYGMVRRMWFVPQSVSTAGFLISGAHNMGVARRQ